MHMARTYTINEICDKFKIPDSTVRHYEKEFADSLSPKRKIGKKRVFTDDDLRVFTEINRMRKQNRSLAEIKEYLEAKTRLSVNTDLLANDLGMLATAYPKPDAPPAMIPTSINENISKGEIELLAKKIDQNTKLQENIIDTMNKIGSLCKEMKGLLDLNLMRYNELSRELQSKHGKRN